MSKTITDLHTEVIANMRSTYDLVDVTPGDKLTGEQAAALVRGDIGTLYELTDEWINEADYASARSDLEEHVREVLAGWDRTDQEYPQGLADEYDFSDQWHEAIDMIRDRDTSNPLLDLAAATPVLLRIPLVDEDDALNPQDCTPRELLTACALPHDLHNIAKAQYILDNTGTTVGMVFVMVGTTADEVWALPTDGQVRIESPYLYVGNPFTGAAMVDGPFHGSLIVGRTDVRTDRNAFGYSWDEICGGTDASSYEASIGRAHTWQDAPDTAVRTCQVCQLVPTSEAEIDTMCVTRPEG